MIVVKIPFDFICRSVFYVSSVVGGWFIFRWFAELLGDYSVLAIFFIPFWCSGCYAIILEIRKARGKGLRQHGILKDRPFD